MRHQNVSWHQAIERNTGTIPVQGDGEGEGGGRFSTARTHQSRVPQLLVSQEELKKESRSATGDSRSLELSDHSTGGQPCQHGLDEDQDIEPAVPHSAAF